MNFDLVRADDAGTDAEVLGFDVKALLDLGGELWKSRTPGDDLDICLRPAETAKGLRRMNAMAADEYGRWYLREREREREGNVVEGGGEGASNIDVHQM